MTMTDADDNPARPGRRNNAPGPDAGAGPDTFDVNRAETQSDFLVVYGTDRKVLYVNPAFAGAMGYAAEKMAGTPLLLYIAEEFRETMAANMAALLETSEPPFYETVLISYDGLRRSVIVKGKPVRYNNQPAALVFLIDMTERKALEDLLRARMEELRQTSTSLLLANKKLNLLSSITRHDINNQLTGLITYLGILETEQSDPALAVYCQNAMTAAEQIAAMIRFTSEYEKIGISAPVWQDCRSIVDTAASLAPLGKVVVHNDLPAGMEVFADPLVEKVFYNLMDNAVRYGRKISAIQFFLSEEDGKVIIVCEDDGDGVTAGDKERIFDRGFGKNSGLGLALSREILDITGIAILETGTPGAGARFEMTVPAESCRFVGAR
ncbi:MAG: PAS domain-containing sensor histidine kinase [Methanoregula sp.]|jgi:PAS domain S-box-containing protein